VKTFLDCYPCFLRQALECARISGTDTKKQKKILDRVMNILLSMNRNSSPPYTARFIYKAIKEVSGVNDPYREIRREDNRQILKMYSYLHSRIFSSSEALFNVCRLAAGGNLLDYGVGKRKDVPDKENIELALESVPVINDFKYLKKDLRNSKLLLYLGDNAGEIVMDKLLIEVIKRDFPEMEIIYAVKGEPVINDVVMEDAKQVGLKKICKVISNGDCAPGTILKFCSSEFKEIYGKADLLIAKGQGNYESLSEVSGGRRIYFLLLAKCPVIANDLKVDIGSMIIKEGRG